MSRNNHVIPCLLAFVCVSLPFLSAQETTKQESEVLFRGASTGQVGLLQQVLPGADPNITDPEGRTPLMRAVSGGHFDAARFLLQQGADPEAKDGGGVSIFGYLKPESNGFTPLNLLLRCYRFLRQESKPAGMPRTPHLVLVDDDFIDHEHDGLKGSYYVNEAERTGRPRVDDDGNGFVDDVYGWNTASDAPLRQPLLSLVRAPENRDFIKSVLPGHTEVMQILSQAAEDAEIDHPLLNTFDNPIVRDFGLEPLMKVGVELNDFTFAELVMNASHGTHVAGIVLDASGGRALLHGIAHGHRQTPKVEEYSQIDWLAQAANSAPDYTAYAGLIRERILRDAVRRGKRCGAYIRVTGAGVVNMSYGRDRTFFRNLAQAMQDLYRDYGAAPETVDSYQCPEGVDVCTDLAIDLAAAGAAEFAIAMADNPEVLFVMAAGNEEANNDLLLPTPAYLSRILPNAMTVASVRESDDLSLFSNYGKRSVQLAAPGEDILSTVVGDAKATMSGTSMAAPTVAGVAALVRAQHPELGAGDVRRILEISARPIPTLEDFLDTGGVLDADEALRLAKSWKVGGQRLFPSELARMGRPEAAEPQATPAPAPPAVEPGAEASPTVPRLASEAELSDGSWRITTLAGYGSSWSVVMSRGPSLPKSQVVVLPVGEN
ncbi:MAG: S8 family serine peptidase, partial [Verrucomicrobiota bacterium]